MHRILIVLLITIVFASCGQNPNDKMIVGRWKSISWLADGRPKNIKIEGVFFAFDSLGQYTFWQPGNTEEGTYKIEKNMLFTKAKGQQEMMVKIELLTLDSLVLGMNNGGTAETLTMIRHTEQPAKISGENKSYLQLTDDGTYRLKPGQRAQIKVYENASTGAYWQISKPKDSAIIRMFSDDYISERNDHNIVGAGGTRIYTIEDMGIGKDSLVLFHGREWEPDSWSFSRYLIVVE